MLTRHGTADADHCLQLCQRWPCFAGFAPVADRQDVSRVRTLDAGENADFPVQPAADSKRRLAGLDSESVTECDEHLRADPESPGVPRISGDEGSGPMDLRSRRGPLSAADFSEHDGACAPLLLRFRESFGKRFLSPVRGDAARGSGRLSHGTAGVCRSTPFACRSS
jgi:hypothetical protein